MVRKKKPTRDTDLPLVAIDLGGHRMLGRDWFEGNGVPYNDGKTFAEIMILNLNTGSMRVRLYESEDNDTAFASNVELMISHIIQDTLTVTL